MSDIVKVPETALVFDETQRKLIRSLYAKDSNGTVASQQEFDALMSVAIARRLNPLLRQVWFVNRRGVWAVQVSIDGLRAIAERSGKYAGQDEPEFIYDGAGKLTCCKVRVYRKDWGDRPSVGVAFMSEYVQPGPFWSGKPHVMLSKVAESLAIRKAFSEDTSGLYVPEEFADEADSSRPTTARDTETPRRTLLAREAEFEDQSPAPPPVAARPAPTPPAPPVAASPAPAAETPPPAPSSGGILGSEPASPTAYNELVALLAKASTPPAMKGLFDRAVEEARRGKLARADYKRFLGQHQARVRVLRGEADAEPSDDELRAAGAL